MVTTLLLQQEQVCEMKKPEKSQISLAMMLRLFGLANYGSIAIFNSFQDGLLCCKIGSLTLLNHI